MELLRERTEANEDDLLVLNMLESGAESRIGTYKSYIDRYFTKYYKTNVRYPSNDHLVLMHSNKIAVCALAPSHPVLDTSRYTVTRVEYVQGVSDEMSGRHKHNASLVNVNQPLCRLHATAVTDVDADQVFVVYSCLNAKLIEVNERLVQQPGLVQSKPTTDGFIAILMPKLDSLKEQLNDLITHDQYLKTLQN